MVQSLCRGKVRDSFRDCKEKRYQKSLMQNEITLKSVLHIYAFFHAEAVREKKQAVFEKI
jgi:hypothetical protein